MNALPARRPALDPLLAGASAAAFGCGAVLVSSGLLGGGFALLCVGAAAASLALLVLLGAEWLDGLVLVALAVPLPALYRTETLRIAAPLPLTVLAVGGWILQRGIARDPIAWGALPRRSILLLSATFLLATVFGEAPLVSARELFNFGILIVLLVVATDAFQRRPERIERTVWALIATGAACGVLGSLEAVGIIPGEFRRAGTPFFRAALGFGQPNGLGLFLALVLPLSVAVAAHGRAPSERRFGSLAAAAIVLGLLGTFSRGSWLSVVFGLFPLASVGGRRFILRACVAAAFVAVVFDLVSGGVLQAIVAGARDDWSVAQRAALMTAGVLTFLAHPLLGVGPGGFAQSVEQFGLLVSRLEDFKPTPHNAYIQMAAETGVLGLIAFVVFLVSLLRSQGALLRERIPHASSYELACRRAGLWALGILVFQCLLDWPFPHGAGQVVMLIVAMGASRAWPRLA